MSDRRIFFPGCGGNCDGGGIPLIGGSSDADILFKQGDIVVSKLTGEKLMVLKSEPDQPITYVVRTGTYQMVQVFEFEIQALNE